MIGDASGHVSTIPPHDLNMRRREKTGRNVEQAGEEVCRLKSSGATKRRKQETKDEPGSLPESGNEKVERSVKREESAVAARNAEARVES